MKPRPIEIKFPWTKSNKYFAADMSLFLGYSSAIHAQEGKCR